MDTVAPVEYWDSRYASQALRYEPEDLPFKEVFEEYLPTGGTCFEIGCYPGPFLIYLGKRFGYTVSGIDTTPYVASQMPEHLRRNGVSVGSLTQGNFFAFDAGRRFDVVCSFGFLEHFKNFREVIRKQAQMVAPGGTIVISCPNFRKLQYALHRWLDPVNLRRHVVAAMDLDVWEETLREQGFSVVHRGYYGTAGFWREDPPPSRFRDWVSRLVTRFCRGIDRRITIPNRWLSPYMICIARRDAVDEQR